MEVKSLLEEIVLNCFDELSGDGIVINCCGRKQKFVRSVNSDQSIQRKSFVQSKYYSNFLEFIVCPNPLSILRDPQITHIHQNFHLEQFLSS